MDEPTGRARRFIDTWFAYRLAIGLTAAVLLGALATVAPEPDYQISLEGLFPARDPLIQSQQRAREAFGDNRFVLMAYQDSDVLTPEGVARTARVESQIREVEGVRDVLCLATLDRQLRLLRSSIVADDVLADRYRTMFLGFTHDHDHQVAGFICLLAPLSHVEEEGQVISALRGVVARPPTVGRDDDNHQPGIVVGEPVLIADAFDSIQRDSVRLQVASTLLLALVLAVCLQSLRWVLVVFGIVQLSILATVATGSLLQLRWSLLSSMLPAIIVVIGAGALTHLAVWSRRNFVEGVLPLDAVKGAVARIFWPVVATCVTDIMGFMALLVSPITPLREFALAVSIGILVFLVVALFLFPLLGCWALGSRSGYPQQAAVPLNKRQIDRFRRRTRFGLVAYVAFVLAAATGIPRLQLETDITKSFRADSEMARSFRFVEKNLGGAGIWEVHIPVELTVTRPLIDRVKVLSAELRELRVDVAEGPDETASVTNVVSLADVVTTTDGSKNFILANTPLALRLQGVSTAMPVFYDTLYGETDSGRKFLRVLIRSQDARSVEWKRALISAVESKVDEHFPLGKVSGSNATTGVAEENNETRVAGTFVVIAQMVERLVSDQWRTLGVALACVYGTLLVFLRRPLVAAIALLPSLMAIIAILGVIGWCEIRIDLGVVMIAAVSLGMAVDGAIHMVNCIDREQAAAQLPGEAVVRGVRDTGGPLAYATLAIVAGFSTLAVSDFMPSVTFGLLVGVATTIGLVGNLTVVPALRMLDV